MKRGFVIVATIFILRLMTDVLIEVGLSNEWKFFMSHDKLDIIVTVYSIIITPMLAYKLLVLLKYNKPVSLKVETGSMKDKWSYIGMLGLASCVSLFIGVKNESLYLIWGSYILGLFLIYFIASLKYKDGFYSNVYIQNMTLVSYKDIISCKEEKNEILISYRESVLGITLENHIKVSVEEVHYEEIKTLVYGL